MSNLASTERMYARMRREILKNPSLVFWVLRLMLIELKFGWEERPSLARGVLDIIRTEANEATAAAKMFALLGGNASVMNERMLSRSTQIHAQIAQHVVGRRILDFGCGDGRVGLESHKAGRSVVGYDVDDYRDPLVRASPCQFTHMWSDLVGQTFDTALAITVFHHCDDPDAEIERLAGVAHRLVVIESVTNPAMPWTLQAFVDWLYNRGLHPAEIPVPGNFRSVRGWKKAFRRHGYTVVTEQDLDIDQPLAPEPHYLLVFEH